jgi:hypothetical protein
LPSSQEEATFIVKQHTQAFVLVFLPRFLGKRFSFPSTCPKIDTFLIAALMIFGWNSIYMFLFSQFARYPIRESNKDRPIKQFNIYIQFL